MEYEIKLKPDKNRPALESRTAKNLEKGIIEDSIGVIGNRERDRKLRVLLVVPPYTRIRKSLNSIEARLRAEENCERDLEKDYKLINRLKESGISEIDEMKRVGIPMGLLRVGTAAKRGGYDVSILDSVFEGWNQEREYFRTEEGNTALIYGLSWEEIEKKIRDYKPDVIGITCDYTHQWGNARHLADIVKRIDEKIVTVMGGTHAHGLPEDALLDSPTDYVVRGQADITFLELLDSLNGKGKDIGDIKGIVYRKGGRIHYTAKRAFMPKIDDIVIPDLSLINLSKYNLDYHSAGKRKTKINEGFLVYGFTSIGCNVGCSFCAIPPVQGGWRGMSDKTLDDYLNYIKGEGVSEILIEDDHLFEDPERALGVFEKLKQYNLSWVEEGGVGLFNLIALLPEVDKEFIESSVKKKVRELGENGMAVTEEVVRKSVFAKTLEAKAKGITAEQVIKAMADSGCYGVYLAVESANSEALHSSNKPTLNTEQRYAEDIIRLFNKYGIKTTCGLMLGFINPNEKSTYVESRGEIEKTLAYGRKLNEVGADFINPFIVTPLPGSPGFSKLLKYSIRNTDEGYTHEFGTMDACDREWTKTELDILRIQFIIDSIGVEGYKEMLKTGTWPV